MMIAASNLDARLPNLMPLGWIQDSANDVHAMLFSRELTDNIADQILATRAAETAARIINPSTLISDFDWSLGTALLFQDLYSADDTPDVSNWYWLSCTKESDCFELDFFCAFPKSRIYRSPDIGEYFIRNCIDKVTTLVTTHLPYHTHVDSSETDLLKKRYRRQILTDDPTTVRLRLMLMIDGWQWEELFSFTERLWRSCDTLLLPIDAIA